MTSAGGRSALIHDVESCVRAIDGVDATCVAVIRLADRESGTGSAVVLFALAQPARHNAGEVAARIRTAALARFGFLPANVVALEPGAFPRHAGGKVRRGALRARWLRRHKQATPVSLVETVEPTASTSATPKPLDLEDAVLRFYRHTLSASATLDSDFFALGGNSLLAAELASRLQANFGIRLPIDALLRWPTPRRLTAALLLHEAAVDLESTAGAVALNAHDRGCPVFLVPGLVPTPWEYQPLLRAARLAQPVYGLRCPDLSWRHDVLTFDEMVIHYVTAIRQARPRGPYALVGFSWGGVVAFEVANRLAADRQDVRRLVLLDTFAPPRSPTRVRLLNGLPPRTWLGSLLARRGVASARVLQWLGADSVRERLAWALGTGPLTAAELARVLRVTSGNARDARPEPSFGALCASVVAAVRASMPEEEWLQTRELRHLPQDDPCAIVKFWKVLVKNRRLAKAHRPTAVFPGVITIYAAHGNTRVLGWRRFSRQPLSIEWLPATGVGVQDAHNAFLEPENVALYADRLRTLLETA